MNRQPTAENRLFAALVVISVVLAACGQRPGTSRATPAAQGSSGAPVELSGTMTIWTFPQGDDEKPIKAIIAAFKKLHPKLEPKLQVIAEGDPYFQKINTSLQAHNAPDIAIIEDRTWMKAGKVVRLDQDYFPKWGVSVGDFNSGGLARGTATGKVEDGIYAIGDFLGGNILVYNKAMFAAAGVADPPLDRSLTIQEYADICRKLTKPNADPNKSVYGCSMPEWAPPIQAKDVFGDDGRHALGNLNSPDMVNAFNVASALIRDKQAPSGSVLEAAAESDLFASGRLGITWTDFTETPKYQENKIDFGLAPFIVIHSGDSFVDTWTAAWGTFNDSKNKDAAIEFLHFIATDGQKLRPTISVDPPLSSKVAQEVGYGKDDPVKAQYLEVLKSAKPQVFVPPGVEAADFAELMRLMTVEGKSDAKPLLDDMAQKAQKQLDQVWDRYDRLGT